MWPLPGGSYLVSDPVSSTASSQPWLKLSGVIIETAKATATATGGPYWFAAVLGIAGVVLGVLIKALIDSLTARSRNMREDRLRFVADKRAAYAEFVAACTDLADVEHRHRQQTIRGREIDARTDVTDVELDVYNNEIEANQDARREAYRELNRTVAIIEMVAPKNVVEAAAIYASRAHHPHLLERRTEAESAFIDSARADLGQEGIGNLPSYGYEDYIEADHPDSGIGSD